MLPTRAHRLLVIFISLGLWLVSIFLPAVQFHENPGSTWSHTITHSGFEMLFFSALFGWFSGNFAFLANPLLLFGWIFLGQQRYRRALCWLAPAPLLAMQTFQLRHTTWHEDEGGVNNSFMTHPVIGWYVWLASILLPLAVAIHWYRIQRALPAPPPPPTA
jgi:hypothetical protein